MLYFTGLMILFTLICCILFIPYGLLIAWYHGAWKAIPEYSPAAAGATSFSTRISVLVPARNEASNIAACLDSLSQQSYPKDLYEVIIIDDHSTDRTREIIHSLVYPDLHFMCLQLADLGSVKAYKKLAIETGIHASTGQLIVTTDADCRFHPDWLRTIATFREETGAKFIAAPVRIGEALTSPPKTSSPFTGQVTERSSFLSVFQTLDFITLQGITGAAVYKNFHSMCNGANLAYAKDAFYEVGGFRGIDDIPSGDDMLLMHKIYKKYPKQVFFLKNPQAIVSTQAATSWSEFINQRIRWASKADRYEDKRIFWVLLLVYLVNLLFLGILVISFRDSRYLWIFLILLILKTMIEFPFVRSAAVFFRQQRLMPWFPALQPFHILYTVVIGWLGKFGSYRWKGRKSA